MAKLGLDYRRIPFLAIGRDIYLDSGLSISKLDTVAATGRNVLDKGPKTPEQKALEWMMNRYVGKMTFRTSAALLPIDGALVKEPAFQADRTALLGFDWRAGVAQRQPGAMSETVATFEFLEHTLLSDGRKWLLNTDAPTAMDIEAVWQIVWLDEFKTAFPDLHFSKDKFPNLRAWVDRFNQVVKEAEQSFGDIPQVSGDEAERLIRNSDFNEQGAAIEHDQNDPLVKSLKLQKGDQVTIWPNDVADKSHTDTGNLVAANREEIVVEIQGQDGKPSIHLHAPFAGVNIKKNTQGNL